jgi:crotonobetainyl-CoA:carnitine CoA-transferase CaiB-like acyl-CoA transferase
MTTALSGIRVAAFTHFAAGPIAAQYLGALGADVVKVEAPRQDVNRYAVRDPDGLLQGISPYFLATNRNQRCLGLDLKSPKGLEAARRLITDSDIVIENYRPGVMERLGLGYEAARGLNPKIIYCSLSAYDAEGAARDRPGQDLLLQALSGLASMTGRGDGPPVPVGAYVIDGFTAMQGLVGILAALRYRDHTGQGQRVSAAMMSSALYLMAQEASYVLNIDDRTQRSRAGIAHANQAAPYGIYSTADGAVAISTFGGPPTVRKLAQAYGILDKIEPWLNEHDLRVRRDEVARHFSDALAPLTSRRAIDLAEPTGAWVVAVRSLADALADPAERGAIRTIEAAYGGSYQVVVEPLKMSATPLVAERPAPAHGEHTRQILAELGYGAVEIDDFVTSTAAFEQGAT